MLKKTVSIIVAALLALALSIPALALTGAQPRYDAPEGYNSHDYQKLVEFLETEVTKPDLGTKTNGRWLFGDAYDPADPATWGDDAFTWVGVGGELQLSAVWIDRPGEAHAAGGLLDLGGCTYLQTLYCDSNLLTGLHAAGCTSLESMSCAYNRLTFLNLEDCAALESCYCWDNALTSIDLTGCFGLYELMCGGNELTELDLSDCESLSGLACYGNSITELDLSACPGLFALDCADNELTAIDLSANPMIMELDISGNGIDELDLSGLEMLAALAVSENPLAELDLSACPELELLEAESCELTALDLSGLEMLGEVWCGDNPLASIDLTGCAELYELHCPTARLTSIDFSDCAYIEMPPVTAQGGGGFGVEVEPSDMTKAPFGDGMWYSLWAYPDDGAEFLGWYAENGDHISDSIQITSEVWEGEDAPWLSYGVLTARFSGGAAMPGDADGDGEITVADALLAMRAAMGLIGADPASEDVDGDGEVTVADALLIMRAAMGLITLD